MSFKRFDPEDIVLSSELITFPTWYTQEGGDTSHLDMVDAVESPEQGFSTDYYKDYYSLYTPPVCEECENSETEEPGFNATYSKALFSVAYAQRPASKSADFTPTVEWLPVTKSEETGKYDPWDSKKVYYTQSGEDPDTHEALYDQVVFPEVKDPDANPPTYWTNTETENGIPELNPSQSYYFRDVIYPTVSPAEIVFGQYRSLVLGDEDSEFRFGNTRVDVDETSRIYADSFIALSVDRSRFREKLDPDTCRIWLSGSNMCLAPDISANRRYLDAGRVFDLAQFTADGRYVYPSGSETEGVTAATSYGYFLPDIGIVLFNTSNNAQLFGKVGSSSADLRYDTGSWSGITDAKKIEAFKANVLRAIDLRSQETVTSNFVFARARNAEFNYSTNPSNITGSAGNLRHDVMINQPQSFITTVGLYNDANELLAVAKLSRPLIKDFTKEALIRIKLDY